jgi:hypothetical protein
VPGRDRAAPVFWDNQESSLSEWIPGQRKPVLREPFGRLPAISQKRPFLRGWDYGVTVLTTLTGECSGRSGWSALANIPAKSDKTAKRCASRSRWGICRFWHECQAVGMVRVDRGIVMVLPPTRARLGQHMLVSILAI